MQRVFLSTFLFLLTWETLLAQEAPNPQRIIEAALKRLAGARQIVISGDQRGLHESAEQNEARAGVFRAVFNEPIEVAGLLEIFRTSRASDTPILEGLEPIGDWMHKLTMQREDGSTEVWTMLGVSQFTIPNSAYIHTLGRQEADSTAISCGSECSALKTP